MLRSNIHLPIFYFFNILAPCCLPYTTSPGLAQAKLAPPVGAGPQTKKTAKENKASSKNSASIEMHGDVGEAAVQIRREGQHWRRVGVVNAAKTEARSESWLSGEASGGPPLCHTSYLELFANVLFSAVARL